MKIFKNKLLIFVITVAILLIVAISLTSRGRTSPTPVEGVLGNILSPVQKVFYSTGQFFYNSFNNLFSLGSLKSENDALHKEVEALREKNRQLLQKDLENKRLRSLLEFKEANAQYKYVAADITGKDPGDWFAVYTIDKGSNEGIKQNQAVIVGNGYLVGKVIEVGSNYAKFMAIVDQRSRVSIVVNRTRDFGIVNGSEEAGVIAIMPIEADIVKGDEISTSGYSTFPKDIYVGKVKSVEKEEKKLVKKVVIEPAADFKRLEEVFVIQ